VAKPGPLHLPPFTLHEAERVSVGLVVDCVRKHREIRNRELLGEVYVRGGELRPGEEDEEEECLICAGVETSLSQSISVFPQSLRRPYQWTPWTTRAFCVTAPRKHVAHRRVSFLGTQPTDNSACISFPSRSSCKPPPRVRLSGNVHELSWTLRVFTSQRPYQVPARIALDSRVPSTLRVAAASPANVDP